MKKLISAAGLACMLLGLGACSGADNEQACKDYVQTVQACGGVYAQTYSESWCSNYNSLSCDLADYFNCMSDALGTCSNGNFANADAMKLSACASKAACN